MKSRMLIVFVFALTPFVFLNVDASCEKNVGSADESCTPAELLEICDTLWSPRYDGHLTSGNIFCNVVYDLNLNEDDVGKLGIHLDWQNYAMESTKEFVDGWGFYQDHAIPDTLQIHPSISMRDSLPPDMKVQISFDYIDESETKRFDESLMIYMKYDPEIIPMPENTWVIMPPHESEPTTDVYDDSEEMRMAGEKVYFAEESMGGGSVTSMFNEYGFQLNAIIIAMLIGLGSFFCLMIFWRKRK